MANIDDSTIKTIKHARKSLLFDSTGVWVKNDENPLFGVTMDSFDGTEVCELVGLCLLSKISVSIDLDNVVLYRDDGLAVINNANGPKLDRMKKNIIATFRSEGLSITIETNLVEADFLDITFNLPTGKCYPYNKPNNAPLYIPAGSNHPPSLVKQLPKLVNKKISDLSCDESAFNNAKVTYELALKHSGYKTEMKFDQQPSRRRNRNRKIIWFRKRLILEKSFSN